MSDHHVLRHPKNMRVSTAEEPNSLAIPVAHSLHNQMPGTLAGGLVMMAITAWLLAGDAPSPYLLVWLAMTGAINVEGWWRWYRFPSASASADEFRRWTRAFALGSGMAGLIWGSTAWLLHPPNGTHTYFVAAAVALASFGALMHNAVHYPALVASVAGTLLPSAAYFIVMGTENAERWIGGLLLMGLAVIVRFGYNHTRATLATLRLSEENGRLRRVAEQASAAKTRFLAGASHDLRQPLHAVSLLSALLRLRTQGMDERDPVRDTALHLDRAVKSMDELLLGVLDISKIDAGVVSPRMQPVALNEMLQATMLHAEPMARAKGLDMRLRLPAQQARVDTDPVLLQRILLNLISNAVRYTSEGGVLLACRPRTDHVLVQVWDTGVGFDNVDAQRVFEEFVQLENRPPDAGLGLGIGLSVVRGLGKLLGGQVRASAKPGKGSCFSLTLPRKT